MKRERRFPETKRCNATLHITLQIAHCTLNTRVDTTTTIVMVERSSTSTVVTYFGGYGSGPLDRTLGAAATLGLGVVLVQSVSRYLRRLNNNNEQSWIATLLSVMRNLMTRSSRSSIDDEEEPSAAIVTGTAVHSGTCHCRSVVFEVSFKLQIAKRCNPIHFSVSVMCPLQIQN